MSETKEMSKRDQVLELLKEGKYTREEIAEKLDMTVASVSSQFTYLRWMGNFIVYNENKILSLVSEEEYNQWLAEREANKKTKTTSSKSPEEQAEALDKTLKNQAKQLENWKEKKAKIERDLQDMPDDEQLKEMLAEADANITLLEIRSKRNQKKMENLADHLEDSDDDEIEGSDEDEDEEELL